MLFQTDNTGTGKVALEVQDIADLRATPGVDRLIIVTHHAQMPTIASQRLDHVVLHLVGILKFVNQKVRKTMAVSVANLGMFPEQAHRLQQQISEVHGVGLLQAFLIALINSGHLLTAMIPGDKLIRQQAAVFWPDQWR